MRKLLITLVVCGAVAGVLAQDASPVFEVATIKLNKSNDPGQSIRRTVTGLTATNMPLRQLIVFAYQIAPFQLVGGPPWVTSDHFDMVAKLEGGRPTEAGPGQGPDAMMLAMRPLLADRFKLKTHRETREMDIFALTMAKAGGSPGPQLKPSTTDCAAVAAARRGGPPGPPSLPPAGAPFCGIMGFPGRIRFGGLPVSQLVQMLGAQTGRMVVDRTGLTGNWDFELTFAAEQRGQPPPGVNIPAPDPDAPSLFTALQEQLGLKLESTKGPVDVTVIDSVEHPTEE